MPGYRVTIRYYLDADCSDSALGEAARMCSDWDSRWGYEDELGLPDNPGLDPLNPGGPGRRDR